MSSDVDSTKADDEEFNCGLLLRDIEEISKALYLHKIPRKALNESHDHHREHVVAKTGISESKSNVAIQDELHIKDKKSSIWNWNPLKALAHIRNHRFNCCFFLHVHTVEGLPPNLNNHNLTVTWKRKDNMLRTRPAQVCLGTAEFEETLMYRCTAYCSRSGPHISVKYEPKLFLLHASVVGSATHDIGNHWIDLSRLLPLTLEELKGDNSSSGKWTTSFKLTGRAKGAMLNVSFGYSIVDGNSFEPGYFMKVPDVVKENGLNHIADFDGSVPRIYTEGSYPHFQSANVKFLQEILPKQGSELSQSVASLYQKFDEREIGNSHIEFVKPKCDSSPESIGGKTVHEFNDTEFDVIKQGIEISMADQTKLGKCGSQKFDISLIETIDVAEIFEGEDTDFDEYVEWKSNLDSNNEYEHECATEDTEHRYNSTCIVEPHLEEVDSTIYDLLTSKPAALDSLLDVNNFSDGDQGSYMISKSSYKAVKLSKSFSLDDFADSIENDFLNMLSPGDIVSDSSHDQLGDLLRVFEEDACENSNHDKVAFVDDFDLSFCIQVVERNHRNVNQSLRNKGNAKMLEDLETEALMHEWGLDENTFQYSPHINSGGFGSPVYLPEEEPLKLPSLEGVGPIIRTKDGGFLRSLNPLLFRNSNNCARLIVQVSAPVVLPSAMGFTDKEILQCWASGGVEKMCVQVNELMPLEDVTGKTIQQVLSEVGSAFNVFNRRTLHGESDVGVESSVEKKQSRYPFAQASDTLDNCSSEQIDSDNVSFKDLIPVAITNIEGLLIEGLKIQSGMPDQEAPSSIMIHLSAPFGEAAEFSLDADELIKYSLLLDEWMRLDSGEVCVEDEVNENILKLSAAHCAKPIELGNGQPILSPAEKVKVLDESCGSLSNNFIMGLKVQLRDPLRNYEAVGSSMLALIQVERILSGHLLGRNCGRRIDEHIAVDGNHTEQNGKKINEPLFKVCQVHLAGLNGNKQLWGSSRQQQSGSRWLHSSGICRPNKNIIISNSKAVAKPSSGLVRKVWPGDVLWSISCPVQGEADTWDDHVALNVHIRNPDIVFPNESVK